MVETQRDPGTPPVVARDVAREIIGVLLLVAGLISAAGGVIAFAGLAGWVIVGGGLVAVIGYRAATRPTPGPGAQPAWSRRAGP